MPQKPNILASANNLGNLVIYERTRHKSFKNTILDDTDLSKVQVRLVINIFLLQQISLQLIGTEIAKDFC